MIRATPSEADFLLHFCFRLLWLPVSGAPCGFGALVAFVSVLPTAPSVLRRSSLVLPPRVSAAAGVRACLLPFFFQRAVGRSNQAQRLPGQAGLIPALSAAVHFAVAPKLHLCSPSTYPFVQLEYVLVVQT
jgi:hypothetical protein